MPISRKTILYVCLCLMAAVLTASAQIDRANLKGTITDPSGALIPNATVTVLFPLTGFRQTATSNSAGDYVFPSLPLGSCSLTVSAPGFAQKELNNVVLEVGQVRTADVQVGLAAGTESVVVNASTATLNRKLQVPSTCQ